MQIGITNNKLQLPASVTKFYVAVPTLSDTAYEGAERFTLTASLPDGQNAIARSTILDDGTGQVYDTHGVVNPAIKGDDDGYLVIPDVMVNEYSPEGAPRYAVFRISASSNYSFTLALQDGGTDPDGNAYAGNAIATATSDGSSTIDYVNALQLYNGTTWVNYSAGSPVNVPKGGTVMLARVQIVNDNVYEGAHAFTLVATPSGGRDVVTARGIIGDFGTGAIFNDSGAEDRYLKKDDDRYIQVDSPIVNEGSHYALFTINGKPNTSIEWSIQENSSSTKDAIHIIPPATPMLQYWDGSAWQEGTSASLPASSDPLATLYVRVDISSEQDINRDSAKDFALQVKDTLTNTKSYGVVSIHDDGTGVIYTFEHTPAPADKDGNGAYAGTSIEGLDDDFDLDGITPTTEEALATLAASQGIGDAKQGDMNGDGEQDSLQNALATLAWRSKEDFTAGNDGTLTDSKAIISIGVVDTATATDQQISSVAQLLNIEVKDYTDIDPSTQVERSTNSDGTVTNTVTLATGNSVTTPWDPIRFAIDVKNDQPAGTTLQDIDPTRDGKQVRVLIDVRASGLTTDEANAYIKYVSVDAITAANNAGNPLKDLDDNAITKAGWYDFTRRTDNGDGARFILEGNKIVAVELIITDNAFGDNDPVLNKIYDPGVLVKKTTNVTDTTKPIYTADQTPNDVDFYGDTSGVPLKTWYNPITGDYFYAPATVVPPYNCYVERTDINAGTVLPVNDPARAFNVHLYLNSSGDTQLAGESSALLDKGYVDLGAIFASAKAPLLDSTAPTVTAFAPNDNTTNVARNSSIEMLFSEEVTKGLAGTIALHEATATGAIVQAHITFDGQKLIINPDNDLLPNTHYFVTVDNGAIIDLAGNNYAGTTTYDFTTGTQGADPYAGNDGYDGLGTGEVLGGVAALGLLAWLVL